jgi:hypothetical protein
MGIQERKKRKEERKKGRKEIDTRNTINALFERN